MFLRLLTIWDVKHFFYAAYDENVYKYMRGLYCDNIDKARKTVEKLLEDPGVTAYVISTKKIPFIGVMILVDQGIEEGKNTYELSYFVNESYRKKGFATEAFKEILQKFKFCRIYLDIVSWNRASLSLAKKFNAIKVENDDSLFFIDT